jgi:hypothetical protein
MAREAKLFVSSSGSPLLAFLKFRANIPPRWIRNARVSRKRMEPEIVHSLHGLAKLRKNRPRAQAAMKHASKELRTLLKHWELAHNKESF